MEFIRSSSDLFAGLCNHIVATDVQSNDVCYDTAVGHYNLATVIGKQTGSSMAGLREEVKRLLGTDKLTTIGGGGGCISSGTAYRTAEGREVFVKVNNKSDVSLCWVLGQFDECIFDRIKFLCQNKELVSLM